MSAALRSDIAGHPVAVGRAASQVRRHRRGRAGGLVSTVVIVPGMRADGDDHWQTWLEATLPDARCVPPLSSRTASLAHRLTLLDMVVQGVTGPVTIFADGIGVLTAVHWASRHPRRVRGAVFVTPPDLAADGRSEQPDIVTLIEHGWLPLPDRVLPFPSIIATDTDNIVGVPEQVKDMAAAWGSLLVPVGPIGYPNPSSGRQEWPVALDLIGCLSGFAR